MGDNIIVTVSCSNMRSWGRQALSGRWGTAALGTLLLMALSSVPILIFHFFFESLDYISNLYSMLVSGPLTLGYVTFILAIFRRKDTSPIEVFYGFERFGKAFGLMFVINVFILLCSLLFIIPGIIESFRYALAFYILADHPEIGIFEAIRESKRLMYGNKWKLFCLELSFIGWFILGLLTAGIGMLWVMPYITTATAGFYEVANGNLRPYYPRLSTEEDDSQSASANNDDDFSGQDK